MFILRLVAVIAIAAVVGGILAFLLSGNRSYLAFSWRVFRYAIIGGLLVFVLLIAERVAVLPL